MEIDSIIADTIRRLVHEKAVRIRAAVAQSNVLNTWKEIMDKHFGAAHVDISNIDDEGLIDEITCALRHRGDIESAGEEYLRANVERHPFCYRTVIHFDSVTIYNSENNYITIRDIYVKFWLCQEGKLVMRQGAYLFGIRSSGSMAEAISKYVHSHLPKTEWDAMCWNAFCLGNGAIDQTTRDLAYHFNPLTIELFCLQLKAYLAWESIEGTPFIQMAEVYEVDNLSANSLKEYTEEEVKFIWELFLAGTAGLSNAAFAEFLNVKADENGFDVAISGAGLSHLQQLILQNFPDSSDNHLVYKDADGNFFPITSQKVSIEPTSQVFLIFKHKPVKMTFYDQPLINPRKYINPNLASGLARELSRAVTQNYLQRDALAW